MFYGLFWYSALYVSERFQRRSFLVLIFLLVDLLEQEIMYKKLLYAISEGQGSFDLS